MLSENPANYNIELRENLEEFGSENINEQENDTKQGSHAFQYKENMAATDDMFDLRDIRLVDVEETRGFGKYVLVRVGDWSERDKYQYLAAVREWMKTQVYSREEREQLETHERMEAQKLKYAQLLMESLKFTEAKELMEARELMQAQVIMEARELMEAQEFMKAQELMEAQELLEAQELMEAQEMMEAQELMNAQEFREAQELLEAQTLREAEELMEAQELMGTRELIWTDEKTEEGEEGKQYGDEGEEEHIVVWKGIVDGVGEAEGGWEEEREGELVWGDESEGEGEGKGEGDSKVPVLTGEFDYDQ